MTCVRTQTNAWSSMIFIFSSERRAIIRTIWPLVARRFRCSPNIHTCPPNTDVLASNTPSHIWARTIAILPVSFNSPAAKHLIFARGDSCRFLPSSQSSASTNPLAVAGVAFPIKDSYHPLGDDRNEVYYWINFDSAGLIQWFDGHRKRMEESRGGASWYWCPKK